MRILRGAAICGAILLFLAACPSGPQDWTKPGAGPGDLERDRQTCRAQAVAMSPLVWDQRSQQVQVDDLDVMQRTTTCMMISGWELTPRK
jgi:hypothetical protein